MNITLDEVAHMAALAKLDLDTATQERFARQFSGILNYMAVLNAIDTQGVSALYQPVHHSAQARPDQVANSLDLEKLLANAPEQDGHYFVVPRIVG